MTCGLFPPRLFAHVPFGDADAYTDFLGHLELWHRVLAQATGTPYYPLGDLRTNLMPNDQMHRALARALGIPSAYDLTSYDLRDRASFQSFLTVEGQDIDRFRLVLGL